jgi:outer membrane protein OmpA-like peptidoglycan-associated protein
MRLVLLAAAGAAGMIAAPGMAQQAQSNQSDVNSYLCTFAGKCGDAQPTDTPTKAAPATKGFHLAAAGQAAPAAQPTMAAPATKGFHLVQAQQPTTAAPATKGFHLAGQTQPTTAAPDTKGFHIAKTTPTRSPARRNYAAGTTAPTPGGARANLELAFEYNSAQMTPAAEAKAKSFAQALMNDALKDKRFLIEGHTDAKGSRDANIDLSRRRAQSVADYLVGQGVDRSRVEVKGVGPDQPLPGHSPNSEANRRVEAVLLS